MEHDHLYRIRHSLAHILAMALRKRDPGVMLATGPVTEDGFFYDVRFSEGVTVSPDDFQKIESDMRGIIARKLPFVRRIVTADEARAIFGKNPFKMEIIAELEKTGTEITVYETGDPGSESGTSFTDLCEGPHIGSTGEIDPGSFTMKGIAGAYWHGDERNEMLVRISGIAFETKADLEKYLTMLEEAKKRDHKRLGVELDLFFIDEEVGKGLPMWTPKGTAIKFALEDMTRSLERRYGYDHVCTPYLGSERLYKASGHLDHYKENMYAPIDMDGNLFYLRPMACPHHIRMLMRKPISYRDLPVRYAEIADYNRYEKSGELMGMIRLRKFQLTDAHIFVAPEQLKEEFKSVCSLIREGMEKLGLADAVSYRFSKRDPKDMHKYYPDDELWEKAESVMKEALDESGFSYTEAEGEAAFYGPKLDVQGRNVNGKEDTLFTAQIDFLLPEKFGLEYTDQHGAKKRPVMIHRSAIGALERTFAFLIEHYAGAFPFWLSPVQTRVIPISETERAYAKNILEKLRVTGIRADIDTSDETLGKKIRNAKLEKIPYLLVIGKNEMANGTATLESRDRGKIGEKTPEEIVELFRKESE
ncbi:MAG: threonine--tRNA ligase [Candidatus Moranbacteria bacterium]|nr:threonine--tRNA ligase [Candidatus Moranbacteria bacterium]